MLNPSEISDVLKQELENINSKVKFEEVGTVLTAGDGVAHVYGLENVRSNELVEFENGAKGVALNLEESNVGVVLLDRVNSITENMSVKRTGEVASIPVGEGLLGRVINMLGEPIDGKGPIEGDRILLPLERKAPGVVFRQPVTTPLQDRHSHRHNHKPESELRGRQAVVLHIRGNRSEGIDRGFDSKHAGEIRRNEIHRRCSRQCVGIRFDALLRPLLGRGYRRIFP